MVSEASRSGAVSEASGSGMVSEASRSFCRFCEAACGIVVDVESDETGERVVRVRGDADNQLSHGYTCPKGRNLPAWHHHPDRLDEPQLRGDDGAQRPADWDEALDDLGVRLASLIDEHGPDSVGVLLATGSAFDANGRRTAERLWQQLGSRSKYTSGSIDTPCKPLVARLMSGFPGLVPTLDPASARLTMFIGCNPVVSHGHLNGLPDPIVTLRPLTQAGRELWVIDPRRTETARLATRHVAPRPGTDHVLLAHLVREVLREGADHEYLTAYTDRADVATVAALVEPFTRDVAAARCDVPPEQLDELVAAIRRHGRVSAQTGTGATMSRAANLTEWLVWVLHIVTGSFDRPGGMWFNPGYLRQLDRRPLGTAADHPAPGPRSRPELKDWLNEFPCSAMCDEIEAGNLRALVVFGGNPMRALPNPERVAAALGRLDVLAVLDVIATDTTELATHVLPVTGQLERADLPLTIDQFVVTLSTQYTPAVVTPGAGRRASWWVFAELAQRLGKSVLPEGLTTSSCSDDDLLRVIADRSRGSWEQLVDERVAVVDPVYGWVLDGVLPEGRWRLAPALLVEQFEGLALVGPAPIALIPRRQVRHLNSQLTSGVDRADQPSVLVSDVDAARLGVIDGALIAISSANGRIEAVATVTDEVRPGVVSVPHGYGAPNVCDLTSSADDIDPHSGMVLQSGVAVTVAPI
jgi:anaerobic selenocysteine-containing dehydrogenase